MQGFNMGRYIPPAALDAGLGNANAVAGKSHALGNRASKLRTQGILTVRFEMPFAVWCSSCSKPSIIAQGVRFNAEKRRVGNYHSTPIWAFRMKHTACNGWIEIRTDPANSEYVVHDGAKRRDYGDDDRTDPDTFPGTTWGILTQEERERRRNDAFAAFEGKQDEVRNDDIHARRLEELHSSAEKHWEDPYASNRKLRRGFRQERKARQRLQQEKEAAQDRFSLGIDLLDESESDRLMANLVEYGQAPLTKGDIDTYPKASFRPMFDQNPPVDEQRKAQSSGDTAVRRSSSKDRVDQSKPLQLQRRLVGNTKAAIDPFDPSSAVFGLSRRYSITGLKKNGPSTTRELGQPGGELQAQNYENSRRPPLIDYYDSE